MSELDDAKEFIERAEKFDKEENAKRAFNNAKTASSPPTAVRENSSEELKNPGAPIQYAMFKDGYFPTTATVNTLPPDCYDIEYSNNVGPYVVPMIKRAGLLLELPEMRSNDVLEIIENFWNSESDYKEGNDFVIGGARYSTGIMIYGPPGGGKTCTIQIANKKLLERGGTVFYSSINPGITMNFLRDFSLIEKNRKCIVVLEDIDTQIDNYGESAFLEMLDSAKTINNVCFIATTNYPERLDPRVYNRPGRLSHVIKIGLPGTKAREAYLKAILKNHRDVEDIVGKTDGFTIDHLTALINAVYREKKDLNSEIKRLRTLFKVPKSGSQSTMGIGREWENE